MMHRLVTAPWRLFSTPPRPPHCRQLGSVEGLEAALPSEAHTRAALPPSLAAGLKPGAARPTGWPAVSQRKAVPYLLSLITQDRAAALCALLQWGPERHPCAEGAALLRALMPAAPELRSEPECWLRSVLLAGGREAAWAAGAVPAASASVLGLLIDVDDTLDVWSPGWSARLLRRLDRQALSMHKPLVEALLRAPVAAPVAQAWARTVCSSGDAASIDYFIAHAAKSPWGAHCAAMAEAMPPYTRQLLGHITFDKLLSRWKLPAVGPGPHVPCHVLRQLVLDGPRNAAAADALLLSPPPFTQPSDYEAWATMVDRTGISYHAGPRARANVVRLQLTHGRRKRICDAAVLRELLRMLPAAEIASLDAGLLDLNNLHAQDAETLLELAHTLRAQHPEAFARLTHCLHRDGTCARAASPTQQASLEALLALNMAEHRHQDLAQWAKNIEPAAPGLGRVLTQLAAACRADAPGWEDPAGRFEAVCAAIHTPPAMRAAIAPLLQAMLMRATPEEARHRAQATLSSLASPLATAADLAQLQALPPAFLAFLRGEPGGEHSTPEALRGLSPMLRDWLLMAVHARLQHAPPTAQHRAFVEGCAEHRDLQRIDEGLDWLELAQRMGASLEPWFKRLPDPERLLGARGLRRCLQRWTAVACSSGAAARQHLTWRGSWAREVYHHGDLPVVLALEAWVAEHLPEALTAQRAAVFCRADLQASAAQQQALGAMLRRLPRVALQNHLTTLRHAWDLAPVAIRQHAARRWLEAGKSSANASLPDDMATLSDCIDLRPPRAPVLERRLLDDAAGLVRAADWAPLLAAHGDAPWLRAVLQKETACAGAAAHSQQNRLAALGRFLHICRVLHIPAAERDAVGALVTQLLALSDVQARHRLLCRLCAALLPAADDNSVDAAALRDAIVALAQPPVPAKAMPLHLALRLYLPPEVAALPAVQALLGTRSVYGDGNVVRQLLHLIMDVAYPDYARQVLGWASRERLVHMLAALRTAAAPAQQSLFAALDQALQRAPQLDAQFYKQTCVRTFLHAHVLPLQRELITCAELVRENVLDLGSLAYPADIYAHCAGVLGMDPAVFERLQRSEPTLRYALGFHSSQGQWDRYPGHEQAPQVLRDLLQACDAGTLHAYRRRSPQVQKLLQLRGGAALMTAWETAPPPETITWPPGAEQATGRWTVEDTGHPTRLLACHTDVYSCQSNNSTYTLNHGMLGRMACGSKRAVLLRDDRGKLRARAMLRVMLSEERKPVLLLSAVYTTAGCSERDAEAALAAHTARRARALGITAVQSGVSQDRTHPLRLISAGDLPDYWDEHGGLQPWLDRSVSARKLC